MHRKVMEMLFSTTVYTYITTYTYIENFIFFGSEKKYNVASMAIPLDMERSATPLRAVPHSVFQI